MPQIQYTGNNVFIKHFLIKEKNEAQNNSPYVTTNKWVYVLKNISLAGTFAKNKLFH